MRSLISLLLVMLGALQAVACGVCGCSAPVGAGSTLPINDRSFIGATYLWSQYLIRDVETQQQLRDFIHRTEIAANIRLLKNWEISAQLPYAINVRNEPGHYEISRGIGDFSLMIRRTILDNTDSAGLPFTHRLTAGVGAVMPTGKFEDDGTLPPGLSPGRGKWQGVVSAAYMARKKAMGAMLYGSYNIIPFTPEGYVPGNALSSDLSFFQVKKWKKWTMIPVEGLHYEHFNKDVSNGYYRLKTGGEGLFLNAALRANFSKMSIQAGYEHPLLQAYSKGDAEQKGRFNFQINYFFKKPKQ